MDLRLKDRHIYITGVSHGIGRATALTVAAEGAVVHGCARGADGLEELRRELPESSREHSVLDALDVRNAMALAGSVQSAAAVAGRLDGVVANAGAGLSGTALGTSADGWTEQLTLKVAGVLHLIHPALPWLEASDAGRAVLISGVTAHHPEPSMAAVSAARATVANLGRSLAVELAGRVNVNVVNLGAIRTGRQLARWRESAPETSWDEWSAEEARSREILAGRLGEPEEVADLVTFLLSPRAGYLTGSSIDLAGGSHGRV